MSTATPIGQQIQLFLNLLCASFSAAPCQNKAGHEQRKKERKKKHGKKPSKQASKKETKQSGQEMARKM